MKSKGILWLICGLPLACFGESGPKVAPVPREPLELVAGQVPAIASGANRKDALELLARVRESYALRTPPLGYNLKVRFTVDSKGQTDYDGAWEMEDVFVPGQGLHWTGKAAAGYSNIGIHSNAGLFNEGTAGLVPLRLEEVRGILLHPLPSDAYASRGSIRTASVTFHDASVTCILLSAERKPALPALGRAWEESEECIDPQSGLLVMHSEAPGRYAVYDYTGAPQLGNHILPKTLTITEGGKVVSTISVEVLDEIDTTDGSLFVPTKAMRTRGRSIELGSTTKLTRVHAPGPLNSGMTVRAVCIVGVVTPTGKLVEAHSLQPSDPNSQVALEDAKGIDFTPLTPAATVPQQHLVFVIEKFISQ
jgi:hypothetical protein